MDTYKSNLILALVVVFIVIILIIMPVHAQTYMYLDYLGTRDLNQNGVMVTNNVYKMVCNGVNPSVYITMIEQQPMRYTVLPQPQQRVMLPQQHKRLEVKR